VHPVRASAPSAALDALAAEYWDAFLETNPLAATVLGDTRFDALLPDPTPEGAAAARGRFAAILGRVTALGPSIADPGDRITLSALRESAGSDVAGLETGLSDWNVDPMEGVPAELLLVPDYQRLETPADGQEMVARWRAMAGYTDRHTETLRRSLADGRVASRAPVARVVAILERLLEDRDDAWPLLAPLAEPGSQSGWSTPERERFATELRGAVAEEIRPAFGRLHEALVMEIMPAARPDERPGMCHVPGGDRAYPRLIRLHTSLDVGADELHRIGLAEIDRIDQELAALAGRVTGARTLGEALAALRTDSALHFVTRDEVFSKAESSLARATEAIPDWFGRLPRTRCEVVRMGQHEEEHSTIAYYRQPASDGSRPGRYYINTFAPETRPRYEAEVLAYHEAIPGHHLQAAIGQELPQAAEFRRHLGPTAFFEGWGLYSERLADEMGLYSGDLDRIGVLSFDAWRASRLVVDTGMHAMGWPRRRAIEFMLEHTALAENNIVNEVDRYIVMPGQALAYKVGQLELLRLRAEASQRLGGAFDIRSFHDVVLGNGAIALPVLREIVEAWAGGSPTAPVT
jgi:uncharacterized protein (DUF885 family)